MVVAYLQSPLANVPTCKATIHAPMDQSQTGEPAKSRIDQGKVRGGAATRTSSVVLVVRVPSTTDVGDRGTREGEQLRRLRD